MNLIEGEQHFRDLINPTVNDDFHSHFYQPLPDMLPHLVILYPGTRNRRIRGLDYLVQLEGINITHVSVGRTLSELALLLPADNLINFLLDIYNNGQYAETEHLPPVTINLGNTILNWEQFKNLIFYLVIQENFNFPQPNYWGLKMPFIRYIEAILSSNYPTLLSFLDLTRRITGGHRNLIPNMPQEYVNSINYILNN